VRIEHWLFGVTLVLLSALGAWWFVLMGRAIDVEYLLRIELAGALAEVGRAEAFAELADWRERKRGMIVGEGALLFLLVGGCTVMLYRLVLSQRRFKRQMEDFIGRVTHDMRTPLAGLRALLETLSSGAMLSAEDRQEALRLGLVQVGRQEHLVSNLLAAQRLQYRSEDPVLEAVDVGALCAALVAERRQLKGPTGPALELKCGDLPLARGSAESIRTIVDNLLDNASEYGAAAVVLTLEAKGGVLRIVCADDGRGFDTTDALTLFEPYVRGTTGRRLRPGGSGLGLAISRGLARSMGGDLTASSAGIDRGARFVLTVSGSE
jgi:signal transduction histidine kinase